MADAPPESPQPEAKSDPRPARRVRAGCIVRWGLRGALVLISVGCLVVAALQGRFSGGSAAEDAAPVVVIDEGPRYGEAVVRVGAETPGSDEAVRRAAREAAGRGDAVVVQVAAGAPQGEVDRVVGLVAAELSAGGRVRLLLADAVDKAE